MKLAIFEEIASFNVQICALTRITHNPLTSRQSDFTIGEYTFKVGGKNKGSKQISGLSNAYVVKDDIETAGLTTLPLWTFGMMY